MRASHDFHDQLNSHLLVLPGNTCSSLWGGTTRYFSSTPNRILPVKKNTYWTLAKETGTPVLLQPCACALPASAIFPCERCNDAQQRSLPSQLCTALDPPIPFPACPLLRPRPVLAHQLHRWLASGASAQLLGLTRLWGTACFLDLRPNFSRSHSLCRYVLANLTKS